MLRSRKKPSDVFPIRFATNNGLAAGFYSFPLSKTTPKKKSNVTFEFDTGEAVLRDDAPSDEAPIPAVNNEPAGNAE